MRLLNTVTFQLEEFFDVTIPPYAILSHRWEDEELTFQNLKIGGYGPLKGYAKVRNACRVACLDGWKYIWMDTCCINKSSSSELSEAINSMFKWYRMAEVCYAYLSDVPSTSGTSSRTSQHYLNNSAFRRSKWFTRGWTLQELLAPETVIFYDESWQEIGTKSSLRELLSEITKIKNMAEFESASVAQKMSWASMRETTRIEDQAYCLLGIFGLNMPTLYGEGRKAFYRLQLEIIKTSDDESIFAWAERDSRATNSELVGLLALSPSAFRRSGDIVRVENLDDSSTPYWMTNKGLRLELTLLEVIIPLPSFHFDGCLFAPLNCEWHGTSKRPGLYLVNVHKDQYLRSKSDKLVSINPGGVGTRQLPREVFYVKQTNELHYTGKANVDLDAVQIHILSVTSALQAGYKLTRFHTARMLTSSDTGIISACQKGDLFDYNSSIFYFNLVPDRIRGAFMFEDGDGDKFIIFINGTNSPWVDIVVPNYSNTESLPDLMRTFDRSIWDTRQSDRISRYIRSGQAVASAKIKPHSLNGGRVCLIDILVDESRTLLYPDPEAHIIRSSH